MKILYLVPTEYKGIEWGGVMTYTLLLAKELSKDKNEITILTPGKRNELLNEKGITVYKIDYNNKKFPGEKFLYNFLPVFTDRLKWMWGVYTFVKSHGPYDMVESPEWGSSSLFISIFRKGIVNVRLHRSLYQYYLDNQLPISLDILLINVLENLSITTASCVTSPTRFMFKTHLVILRVLKIFKTPFEVIPNGIEIPALRSNQDKKSFFLTVGRLEPGKGYHLLVKAFSKITRENPSLMLLFIGRDIMIKKGKRFVSYKKYLLKIAKDNGIEKRLTILSQKTQKQLAKYYRSSLAYIIPSIGSENHPYVLLDALRWGKAVIASDAGGIPEIIENGKSGILFKENSVPDLIKALEKILTDNKLFNSIGKYNLRYRNNFNILDMADMTSKFYRRVLNPYV